ncbi:MAG: ABC transporter permease subunit [Candidatus Saccharimonadales bacterium]
MRDIIAWELARRKNTIFWWCIGSVVLTTFILFLYPSIRDQAEQLNKVINTLPEGLRGLKTGQSTSVNVADPVGFLNSQLFYATLPIVWIILAITRASGALGKEESSHTLELLLARPISRTRLLLAKAISVTLELCFVGAATLLAILVVVQIINMAISAKYLLLGTIFTVLFSLSFGAIAFALQAASKASRRVATTVAVAVAFGGYIIASLSGLTDWLRGPAKFAPFHYFTPETILRGNIPKGLVIYLVGTALVCTLAAWLGFRRRDIE